MHYRFHAKLHLFLKALLPVCMKSATKDENWMVHWVTVLIECLPECSIKRYVPYNYRNVFQVDHLLHIIRIYIKLLFR